MTREVTLTALSGIKLVGPGDDLGAIAVAALRENGLIPKDGDVLVVAQKIVSKAEGRYVDISTVRPSERAIALAAEVDKDPRFVEVVLSESTRVVRHRPGLLMGQADEAMPMVLVRGLAWSAPDLPVAALIRPAEHDLFR